MKAEAEDEKSSCESEGPGNEVETNVHLGCRRSRQVYLMPVENRATS
jgi:hypothetical protein